MTDNTLTDPYIEKLRALKPKFAEMNIKRLRVFGSRARGDAHPDSDLDLLVDMSDTADMLDFIGLQTELSDILDIPVDLATQNSFKHPYIKKSVMEDARDV